MVKFIEEEKEVTVQEIVDAIRDHKYYVEETSYGVEDNIIQVLILDVRIDLKGTSFCPNSVYGPKWFVDFCSTYCYLSEALAPDFDLRNIGDEHKFDAYCLDYKVDHLEEIFNQKVKVIGHVENVYEEVKKEKNWWEV